MSTKVAFRKLLRSANIVFKQDLFALNQAKITLKAEFLKNKNISDPIELDALLRGVEEVDEMLRFNIIQGSLNARGNYGI